MSSSSKAVTGRRTPKCAQPDEGGQLAPQWCVAGPWGGPLALGGLRGRCSWGDGPRLVWGRAVGAGDGGSPVDKGQWPGPVAGTPPGCGGIGGACRGWSRRSAPGYCLATLRVGRGEDSGRGLGDLSPRATAVTGRRTPKMVAAGPLCRPAGLVSVLRSWLSVSGDCAPARGARQT